MRKFTTEEIRELFDRVMAEGISFSRMVEIMNEMVSESEKPVRKFKKGDKVQIKYGVSSKTHRNIRPGFSEEMDNSIGTTMTVNRYSSLETSYVLCDESEFAFHEEWLEPYTDELKEGDLAIFWDDHIEGAIIHLFDRHLSPSYFFPYVDKTGMRWENAIKFESKEQFEKLIKGEI